MLAEVFSVTLSDGVERLVPGSSLVFTQRTILHQDPNNSVISCLLHHEELLLLAESV